MEEFVSNQSLDRCALLVVDGATAVVRRHKNAPYKQTKEELSVWSIVVVWLHLVEKSYSPS